MTDLSQFPQTPREPSVRVADTDPVETREWLQALDAIVENEGRERATFVLKRLLDHARQQRVPLPSVVNTPYRNTISLEQQPQFPGNAELEAAADRAGALECAGDGGARQPRASRAGRAHRDLRFDRGSVRSRIQSFLPAPHGDRVAERGGDLVYFQPHAATGVYARAFLDGRLSEDAARPLSARDRRSRGGAPASLASAHKGQGCPPIPTHG